MTNRILRYLDCECCAARGAVQRLEATADELIELSGGLVEIVVPGLTSYTDGNREVIFFLRAEIDEADCRDDLRGHLLAQLRGIGREIDHAVKALEAEGRDA